MKSSVKRAAFAAMLLLSAQSASAIEVYPDNARWFVDEGRPVALFGSGYWTIIPDPTVDIEEHNAWYAGWGGNANRATLFAFCTGVEDGKGLGPWLRTGPGLANDGQPKFDLEQPNPAFWERYHAYMESCERHGLYVLLQIFDEPFVEGGRDRWLLNPFNPENNVNDLPGLPGGDGSGEAAFYDPGNGPLMAVQDALVRRLLDESAPYDHIVYEIGNEINMDGVVPTAAAWQRHWVDFFRAYAREHDRKLLLTNDTRRDLMEHDRDGFSVINHHGFTHFRIPGSDPLEIARTVRDAVYKDYEAYRRPIVNSRPCSDPDRRDYPDVAAEEGGRALYWSYFMSGGHVIGFRTTKESRTDGEAAERILKHLHAFIARTPFVDMAPAPDKVEGDALCLADPGDAYALYLPVGGKARLDLRGVEEALTLRWYDPRTGAWTAPKEAPAGEWLVLEAPDAGDWAALLMTDAMAW